MTTQQQPRDEYVANLQREVTAANERNRRFKTALEQICYVEGVNPKAYKIAMTALKD